MKQIPITLEECDNKKWIIRNVLPQKYQDDLARLRATEESRSYQSKSDKINELREDWEEKHPNEEFDDALIPKELAYTAKEIDSSLIMRNIILKGITIDPKIDDKYLDSDDCDSVEMSVLFFKIMEVLFGPESKYAALKKKDMKSLNILKPNP